MYTAHMFADAILKRCNQKITNLGHLGPLAEFFGVDCARVQAIKQMAYKDAISQNLC